jgi:hypothetical protein
VTAVDEPAAAGGRCRVEMRHGHVERQPCERWRGVDDVSALAGPRPPLADVGEVRPGGGLAVGGEVEPGGRRAQRLRLEVGGVADLVARLAGGRVAQGQHRAAGEVEHGTVVLVDGADPQEGEAGGPAALSRAVLAPCDDLGRGAQGVTEAHGTVKQQAAVEEVGDHPASRHGGLADRGVPNETGVRDRRPLAEHCLRQRAVEGESQAVPRDRLVQHCMTLGEREGGCRGEEQPDL